MVFEKFSISRMKAKWEKAISDNQISHVQMKDDHSIVVHKLIVAQVSGKVVSNALFDTYRQDEVASKAMLAITGPMEPGDVHFFKMKHEGQSYEDDWEPKLLAQSLETGYAEKAEMTEDGKILLWIEYDAERPLRAMDFSSKPFLDAIQSVTGPMKPGDVYHFKKEEDDD